MYGEKSNRVMKNLEEVIQILKENDRILKERFKIKSIGVFGSVTKGEQKETSDVDVIVEFYEPVGWEIVDLKEFLEELLGVRVDVVTKRAAMRKSILWKSIEREIVYV
ncbi:MAG: nucleotidyltransferase family protein [Archaeoglobus sp.]|nr:nucleotidyltransferase family protein [Archaeoglobus sp.]